MNIITSPNNEIIQRIKSLHNKKAREEDKEFFIEGYRFVKEAFSNNAELVLLAVGEEVEDKIKTEISKYGEKKNIPVYFISSKVAKQISDTQTPQEIFGVLRKPKFDTEKVINNSSFMLLLESVQDPGNMGTIIRTADAAGVDSIFLSKGCVDLFNPKTLRSTMGSIFHIPIIKVESFNELISDLKNNNFNIFAAHPYGKKTCYEIDMKGKTGIIIGNEANGLTDEILSKCLQIKIPMPGKAESLNAAVSAGILIYEWVRQKLR